MRISKLLLAVSLGALLSTTALAQQQAPPQGGQAPAQGADAQGGGSSDGVTLDPTPFMNAVDTNKDNKVTAEEWKAAGLPDVVYEMFDKEKAGSFSKESLAEKTHPPEMDANKDGKFSLDELKAHIERQSKGSGASEGGGAPQGGAPQK